MQFEAQPFEYWAQSRLVVGGAIVAVRGDEGEGKRADVADLAASRWRVMGSVSGFKAGKSSNLMSGATVGMGEPLDTKSASSAPPAMSRT